MMKSRLVWVVLPLGITLMVGTLILSRRNGVVPTSSEVSIIAFANLSMLAVALLIASRRPHNAVGWILLAGSLSMLLTQFITQWARFTLLTQPGALPLGLAAAWVSLWIWVLMIFFLFILLPLLFPTGRPLSSKWRVVLWLTGLGLLVVILTFGLAPGPMEELEPARNPLGLEVLAPIYASIEVFSTLIFLLLIGLALVSVVIRYRVSKGDERAQMKWIQIK